MIHQQMYKSQAIPKWKPQPNLTSSLDSYYSMPNSKSLSIAGPADRSQASNLSLSSNLLSLPSNLSFNLANIRQPVNTLSQQQSSDSLTIIMTLAAQSVVTGGSHAVNKELSSRSTNRKSVDLDNMSDIHIDVQENLDKNLNEKEDESDNYNIIVNSKRTSRMQSGGPEHVPAKPQRVSVSKNRRSVSTDTITNSNNLKLGLQHQNFKQPTGSMTMSHQYNKQKLQQSNSLKVPELSQNQNENQMNLKPETQRPSRRQNSKNRLGQNQIQNQNENQLLKPEGPSQKPKRASRRISAIPNRQSANVNFNMDSVVGSRGLGGRGLGSRGINSKWKRKSKSLEAEDREISSENKEVESLAIKPKAISDSVSKDFLLSRSGSALSETEM